MYAFALDISKLCIEFVQNIKSKKEKNTCKYSDNSTKKIEIFVFNFTI